MKNRIIKASPALLPQLVPMAPRWLNAVLFVALIAVVTVALPKTPESLVALSLGGLGFAGMIIDAQLLFSDAQALTATAVSTNIIDLGADRNIGQGEPMAVVVCIDVAADRTTGDETYTVTLQTDDNAAFSSASSVGGAYSILVYPAGTRFVIPLPAGTETERFVRLNYTLGGTTPTITVTAFLQPLAMASVGENVYYADAITIG